MDEFSQVLHIASKKDKGKGTLRLKEQKEKSEEGDSLPQLRMNPYTVKQKQESKGLKNPLQEL